VDLIELLTKALSGRAPKAQPTVGQGTPRRVARVTAPPSRRARGIVVGPDKRPLWQIRGWRRKGKRYVGAYRTPWRSFSGSIEFGGRSASYFILNPPAAVLEGSHGACFRPRGGGWFFIHFRVAPPEVDAGIAAVEALLLRSLKGH